MMIDLGEFTIRDEAAQCLEDYFCGANCRNRKPMPNGGIGKCQCESCEIWKLIRKIITVSALKWHYLRGSYGEPTGWYLCPVCSHASKEATNFCAFCGQRFEDAGDERE